MLVLERVGGQAEVPAESRQRAIGQHEGRGALDQLENTMQSGGQHGMRTMDSAIQELLDKTVITGRSAYEKGINKQRFEHLKDMG